MIILVLNSGSSSIKYQVLDMESKDNHKLLAKGLVERIGLEDGIVTHSVPGADKYKLNKVIANHTRGIEAVLDLLIDSTHGVLKSLKDIDAVGHRMVHGGEIFNKSRLIDSEVIKGVEACNPLAPLHNPACLLGVKAVTEALPGVPQVGVFDTSFHQTIPDYAYMYAIPYHYYKEDKIRKYGFHGTSHRYVSAKGAKFAGLDYCSSRIITCHLGNGCSITAIKNGKSIDTTMGLTPMGGVMMGTRCGTIDPSVPIYLMHKYNVSVGDMDTMLNKKSGFLGVSGVSPDMRDVEVAAAKGDEHAVLALKMFRYGIIKYVGAYAAAMKGVDLIIFTGGIGENDPITREEVSEQFAFIGVDFDADANKNVKRGEPAIVSKKNSKVTVAVVPTDEELMIAVDTMEIVSASKAG